MARPKKTVNYNASSETVRRFFERSMQLREEQRDIGTLISSLNIEMSNAGVDPGVLSLCRRVASMPEGKRGTTIALVRFYFDVLNDILADAQVDVNDMIRQAKAREMESVAPEQQKLRVASTG